MRSSGLVSPPSNFYPYFHASVSELKNFVSIRYRIKQRRLNKNGIVGGK